tara:strand:- start:5553 stop:6338 length:786 start_codon:yes stop_codon:yes gene_type:complete
MRRARDPGAPFFYDVTAQMTTSPARTALNRTDITQIISDFKRNDRHTLYYYGEPFTKKVLVWTCIKKPTTPNVGPVWTIPNAIGATLCVHVEPPTHDYTTYTPGVGQPSAIFHVQQLLNFRTGFINRGVLENATDLRIPPIEVDHRVLEFEYKFSQYNLQTFVTKTLFRQPFFKNMLHTFYDQADSVHRGEYFALEFDVKLQKFLYAVDKIRPGATINEHGLPVGGHYSAALGTGTYIQKRKKKSKSKRKKKRSRRTIYQS